ncbi:alpha/beta hydrolase [Flavobacteriaceae bacterium 3-367]
MKIVSKIFKSLLAIVVVVVLVYFFGPKVEKPNLDTALPSVNANLSQLEVEIREREAANPLIKPENEGRIVWFDSIPAKTPYSIVYLHGWSASSKEGDPLHLEMAKRYGCNLYLPRLAGHGLNEKEPMLNLTANRLIDSAKEAIAVAKQLGEKVIVMATSTGGTLALHLVGDDQDIAAVLLFSPNIEIYDPSAKLLAGPWGLQLARAVKNSDYHEFKASELKKRFWTSKYRVEALTHLQALVDHTMRRETFERMTRPSFVGYFYKNDSVQDRVISIPAVLQMFEVLGTETSQKRKVAFPEVGNHVMTSSITSKDLESVRYETEKFLEEVVRLQPWGQ